MVELTSSEAHELSKPGRTLEEVLKFAGLRSWITPPARRGRDTAFSVTAPTGVKVG
jgi:hypothetical protein